MGRGRNRFFNACVGEGHFLHSGIEFSSWNSPEARSKILFYSIPSCKKCPSPTHALKNVYVSRVCSLLVTDHSYREWSPSLVAAACIAASRACLHLTPFWNAALHKLTAYNWADVQPVTELMLRYVMDRLTPSFWNCAQDKLTVNDRECTISHITHARVYYVKVINLMVIKLGF